jgi:hypothetical protein
LNELRECRSSAAAHLAQLTGGCGSLDRISGTERANKRVDICFPLRRFVSLRACGGEERRCETARKQSDCD